MSGGVDSSVAAALLQQQGFEVVGVTMKLYPDSGKASMKSCCGFAPAFDARCVAEQLGIRYSVVNAEELFQEKVVDDFCREYAAGRTPNPCIRCNTYLKFDFLIAKATELGCAYVATGHYAQIRDNRLYRANDRAKDQSYFLYTLTRKNIGRILFPVGDKEKSETRAIARSLNLPVHDKEESQDICFLPRGKYREFLEDHGIVGGPGPIVTLLGETVGTHTGLHCYTIGQRKGLGPLGERSYVVSMDPEANVLVVGSKDDVLANTIEVRALSVCNDPIVDGGQYDVLIRYKAKPKKAQVFVTGPDTLKIIFTEPVDAPAAGQAAVLYRDTEVMGGGIISRKVS